MDKELGAYLRGETNVLDLSKVTTKIILSREKTNKGQECIHLTLENGDLYRFWNTVEKEKPKSTGGKKPYVMIMCNEVEKLATMGVKNIEELTGFLVMLSPMVEWKTGRLINKRSKKPLKYDDLSKKYTCGKYKLDKLLKTLSKYGLLIHTTDGYFISRKFIKKGATK